MLIRSVEVDRRGPFDVRVENGRIVAIEPELEREGGEEVLEGGCGALIPGLHDHHIHLLALAAAQRSVRCGPPDVTTTEQLERALHAFDARVPWVRGIGYDESVAGALDRARMDRLIAERPARIQHRSGAAWFLNSRAVELLGLDRDATAPVERDERGRATGRVFRADAWLRTRLGPTEAPDLAAVSLQLASYGVTGLTDATAHNGPEELAIFRDASAAGALSQELLVMGGDALFDDGGAPAVRIAARKILLDERALPPLDELAATIARAHSAGRCIAVHCVERVELVLACEALVLAGPVPGDRIEHAAVTPPDLASRLAELGVTVVTQPSFVRERGDSYLARVDAVDLPWLYRVGGLLDAGVAVGAGTDAPFGDADPWLAMKAAVERTTRTGRALGADERVTPERALALFTSDAAAPGGAPRAIARGACADLCLLDRPWSRARATLARAMVRATIREGRVVWRRADPESACD